MNYIETGFVILDEATWQFEVCSILSKSISIPILLSLIWTWSEFSLVSDFCVQPSSLFLTSLPTFVTTDVCRTKTSIYILKNELGDV